MIPNAWFYKLKQIATRNPNKNPTTPIPIPIPIPPPQPHLRKSYYFTRPPAASNFDPPTKPPNNLSSKCDENHSVSEVVLAPINTRRNGPEKKSGGVHGPFHHPLNLNKTTHSSVFNDKGSRPVRRLSTGSPRVRVRINSPRLGRRSRIKSSKASMLSSITRKSISSESVAVVKSSFDPQRDFRESMVEMIVENNIRTSKELEELLACYLSLNSYEYHDVIIHVFRQIWFEVNHIKRV